MRGPVEDVITATVKRALRESGVEDLTRDVGTMKSMLLELASSTRDVGLTEQRVARLEERMEAVLSALQAIHGVTNPLTDADYLDGRSTYRQEEVSR